MRGLSSRSAPVLVLVLLSAVSVQAANYSWIGPSGADNTDSDNWSPSGSPASGDQITYPSSSVAFVRGTLDVATWIVDDASVITVEDTLICHVDGTTIHNTGSPGQVLVDGASGVVDVQAGCELTVYGILSIDGLVKVQNNGVLKFAPGSTLEGTGTLSIFAGGVVDMEDVRIGASRPTIIVNGDLSLTLGNSFDSWQGSPINVQGAGTMTFIVPDSATGSIDLDGTSSLSVATGGQLKILSHSMSTVSPGFSGSFAVPMAGSLYINCTNNALFHLPLHTHPTSSSVEVVQGRGSISIAGNSNGSFKVSGAGNDLTLTAAQEIHGSATIADDSTFALCSDSNADMILGTGFTTSGGGLLRLGSMDGGSCSGSVALAGAVQNLELDAQPFRFLSSSDTITVNALLSLLDALTASSDAGTIQASDLEIAPNSNAQLTNTQIEVSGSCTWGSGTSGSISQDSMSMISCDSMEIGGNHNIYIESSVAGQLKAKNLRMLSGQATLATRAELNNITVESFGTLVLSDDVFMVNGSVSVASSAGLGLRSGHIMDSQFSVSSSGGYVYWCPSINNLVVEGDVSVTGGGIFYMFSTYGLTLPYCDANIELNNKATLRIGTHESYIENSSEGNGILYVYPGSVIKVDDGTWNQRGRDILGEGAIDVTDSGHASVSMSGGTRQMNVHFTVASTAQLDSAEVVIGNWTIAAGGELNVTSSNSFVSIDPASAYSSVKIEGRLNMVAFNWLVLNFNIPVHLTGTLAMEVGAIYFNQAPPSPWTGTILYNHPDNTYLEFNTPTEDIPSNVYTFGANQVRPHPVQTGGGNTPLARFIFNEAVNLTIDNANGHWDDIELSVSGELRLQPGSTYKFHELAMDGPMRRAAAGAVPVVQPTSLNWVDAQPTRYAILDGVAVALEEEGDGYINAPSVELLNSAYLDILANATLTFGSYCGGSMIIKSGDATGKLKSEKAGTMLASLCNTGNTLTLGENVGGAFQGTLMIQDSTVYRDSGFVMAQNSFIQMGSGGSLSCGAGSRLELSSGASLGGRNGDVACDTHVKSGGAIHIGGRGADTDCDGCSPLYISGQLAMDPGAKLEIDPYDLLIVGNEIKWLSADVIVSDSNGFQSYAGGDIINVIDYQWFGCPSIGNLDINNITLSSHGFCQNATIEQDSCSIRLSLDQSTFQWSELTVSGETETLGRRRQHVMEYDASNERILFFGGLHTDEGYLQTSMDELFELDLDTLSLTEIMQPAVPVNGTNTTVTWPSPRKQAASTLHQDKLYVIGGQDDINALQEAFVYDTASGNWTQLPNPPDYVIAGAAAGLGEDIWVFEGTTTLYDCYSNGFLSNGGQMYRYSISNATWTSAGSPGPTYAYTGSAMVPSTGMWYFIGGFDSSCQPQAQLWQFDTNTTTWTSLTPTGDALPHVVEPFVWHYGNGKIGVTAGHQFYTVLGTHAVYDSVANTFTNECRNRYDYGFNGAAIANVNGTLYAHGGSLQFSVDRELPTVAAFGCALGHYSDGQGGCAACPIGTDLSRPGLTACEPCTVGHYADKAGTAICEECAGGSYQNTTGADSCLMCPAGYYCDQGAVDPVACTPGTHNPSSGGADISACADCPPGRANNQTAATTCDVCSMGEYATGYGNLACYECNPGSIAPAVETDVCSPCSLGEEQPLGGQTSCSQCTIGNFASSVGTDVCEPCPRGQYGLGVGESSCTLCSAGTFQNFTGQTTCEPCGEGTYASAPGAGLCDPCEYGYVNDVPYATACEICPVTQYSDVEGGRACKDCPANTASPNEGAGALTDCVCEPGFFREDQAAGQECIECVVGGFCEGGTALPVAQPGFWSDPDDPLIFLQCTSTDACPGGEAGTCDPKYTGRMCGECAPRHYPLSGRCEPCPEDDTLKWVAVIGAFLFAVGFLVAALKSGLNFASMAISFSFFQVTSVYVGMEVPWPLPVMAYFDLFSAMNFNMDLASPECSMDVTYTGKWMAAMAMPFVALAFFIVPLVFIFAAAAFKKLKAKLNKAKAAPSRPASGEVTGPIDNVVPDAPMFVDGKLRMILNFLTQGFLTFLAFAYLYLSSRSMEVFKCTEQVDGTFSYDAYPSMQCNTEEWASMVPVAIAGVLVYSMGIPLVFFLLLHRNRKRLASTSFHQMAGFLYKRYEEEAYYWEVIVMMRKLLFAVIPTLLDDAIVQTNLGLIGLFACLMLQTYMSPYDWRGHDNLEFSLLAVDLIVLFGGILFSSGKLSEGDSDSVGGFLVFTLFSSIVVIIIVNVVDLYSQLSNAKLVTKLMWKIKSKKSKKNQKRKLMKAEEKAAKANSKNPDGKKAAKAANSVEKARAAYAARKTLRNSAEYVTQFHSLLAMAPLILANAQDKDRQEVFDGLEKLLAHVNGVKPVTLSRQMTAPLEIDEDKVVLPGTPDESPSSPDDGDQAEKPDGTPGAVQTTASTSE